MHYSSCWKLAIHLSLIWRPKSKPEPWRQLRYHLDHTNNVIAHQQYHESVSWTGSSSGTRFSLAEGVSWPNDKMWPASHAISSLVKRDKRTKQIDTPTLTSCTIPSNYNFFSFLSRTHSHNIQKHSEYPAPVISSSKTVRQQHGAPPFGVLNCHW